MSKSNHSACRQSGGGVQVNLSPVSVQGGLVRVQSGRPPCKGGPGEAWLVEAGGGVSHWSRQDNSGLCWASRPHLGC